MIECSFCRTKFDEQESVKGCSGCPMTKTCSKIKCPNCGYEIHKEPGLIRFFKRLFSSAKVSCHTQTGKTSLACLKAGETVIIHSLATNDPGILKKLMCMGILPGASLNLLQTYPAYVIQVGFTQVAIDKDIASVIMIDK